MIMQRHLSSSYATPNLFSWTLLKFESKKEDIKISCQKIDHLQLNFNYFRIVISSQSIIGFNRDPHVIDAR